MIGLLPVWTTVSMNFDTINIYSLTQPFLVSSHNAPPHGEGPPERGGGGNPLMKGVGMFLVSLKGVNFGFWSHLGCSGQNAIMFRREGPRLGLHVKKYKNMYVLSVF